MCKAETLAAQGAADALPVITLPPPVIKEQVSARLDRRQGNDCHAVTLASGLTPPLRNISSTPASVRAWGTAGVEVLPLRASGISQFELNGLPPLVLPPLVARWRPLDPGNPFDPLRELYDKAAQTHGSMDSYTLRLRRREVVGNQSRPEDVLFVKWRKEPWSVYCKWLGPEGKGRELVYVKGHYENAVHTVMTTGRMPFLQARKRFKAAADDVLLKSDSRYPVTEADLGALIKRFCALLDARERGDTPQVTLTYLGHVWRPEFKNMVKEVLQEIPPDQEPQLLRGGQRQWFFDPESHLPILIVTEDDTGREVEYHCYDCVMFPAYLTDNDFNPDVLWQVPPSH
jgi:hypothetical protein